jgi:peptide/nickel transport system substrate-binding protein
MGHRRNRIGQWALVVLALGVLGLTTLVPSIWAQDKPRSGGELIFAVPSEPPSYDGHREETFGLIHPVAPFYSLLLRVDPEDPNKIEGDLAEGWTISEDELTYTFKIRKGVQFHDGSLLTAKDVKATYDKIVFPPAGVASTRKGQYEMVEAIEAPDDQTPGVAVELHLQSRYPGQGCALV